MLELRQHSDIPRHDRAAAGGRYLSLPRCLVSRWPAFTVFCAVAVVYISTGTYGANQSRDTMTAAVAAWAIGARHTLDLSFLQMAKHSLLLWAVPGAHGSLVSNRFPGAVLLAVPLYALVGGQYSPLPGTITRSEEHT